MDYAGQLPLILHILKKKKSIDLFLKILIITQRIQKNKK